MTLRLVEQETLIDNVTAFRFTPSQPLTWQAGQFIEVELPHPHPDSEGTKRWFTISSAPYEGIVQITTRVTQTTFKQALAALQPSDELQLLGEPEGDFTWEDSALPKVFIAGGIGVTPFYSILKQRVHDRLPLAVTLIYTGRTAALPFKDEFARWAAADPELDIDYVIGERLTAATAYGLLPKLSSSLVYVSGPEPMVEALGNDLQTHGLPAAQLKQDFFPNYTEKNY